MKKRLFALAVIAGIVLSFGASAFAATYHGITYVAADYLAVHRITSRTDSNVEIKIAFLVSAYGDNTSAAGFPSNAANVKLSLTGAETVVRSAEFTNDTFSVPSSGYSFKETILNVVTNETGGDLIVTAQLVDSSGNAVSGTSSNATTTIVFDSQNLDDETNSNYPSSNSGPYSGVPVYDAEDDGNDLDDGPADPNSTNWVGYDPTFGPSSATGNNKDKPKIATSKIEDFTSGTAGTATIKITGPSPIVDVYIAAKDAKKAVIDPDTGDFYAGTTDIQLTRNNILKYKLPFRIISRDINTTNPTSQDKTTEHTITLAYSGAHVAYKGFPLTVSAANDKTGTKPVSKTYKINVNSARSTPQWVENSSGKVGEKLDKKNTSEVTVQLRNGQSVGAVSYTASADAPYVITVKPANKDGVTATVVQPVINRYGEVTIAGYVNIGGTFADDKVKKGDSWKEAKVAFTMTATASAKKANIKSNITAKTPPYFDKTVNITTYGPNDDETALVPVSSADYIATKRVEAGKVPSIKFGAKGSKTITYTIDDESQAALEDVGLSFDLKKGAIVALKDKKDIIPTVGHVPHLYTEKLEDGTTESWVNYDYGFKSVDITVTADNGAGTAQIMAQVAVTGKKPKLTTKTITLSRDEVAMIGAGDVLSDYPIKTDADEKADYQECLFSVTDSKSAKALADLGLAIYENEMSTEGYLVVVSPDLVAATKGTSIKLDMDRWGAQASGSFKLIIADPAPEVSGDNAIAFTSLSKDTTGKSITLGLKEDPTGDTKLTWKLKTKPTTKDLKAELKAAKDGKSATFTVKVNKDLSAAVTGDKAVITVTNGATKAETEHTVTIVAANASSTPTGDPEDTGISAAVVRNGNGAAPEAAAEAEAEAETEAAEAKAVFGAPRTAANLTAGQASFIAEKGYTIIAVLPEVSSEAEGRVEIDVALDENAKEFAGKKLVYLAFPQNAADSDDDDAVFYAEDGEEIEEVPAADSITVAPWLRAGVTYQPVIAAE